MENIAKQVMMLGLPESGKTSFIAALYHYVSAIREGKTFDEYKQSNDTTYLNKISENWLACKKPYRTASLTGISNKEVKLHLQKTGTEQKIDLNIPDIAGESFMQQFTNRFWENHYKQQVEEATGLLVFINPEFIKHHVLIDDLSKSINLLNLDDDEKSLQIESITKKSTSQVFEKQEIKDSLVDESNIVKAEEESSENNPTEVVDEVIVPETAPILGNNITKQSIVIEQEELTVELQNVKAEAEKPVPFILEDSPSQVVLIDILENHREIMISPKLSVAIIISAWDEILDNGIEMTPRKWLLVHLPLLYQYLISNFETFSFEVFGVSAQGGSFIDADKVKTLQDFDEPSDRIIVQENDHKDNNICAPIEWIIKQ